MDKLGVFHATVSWKNAYFCIEFVILKERVSALSAYSLWPQSDPFTNRYSKGISLASR